MSLGPTKEKLEFNGVPIPVGLSGLKHKRSNDPWPAANHRLAVHPAFSNAWRLCSTACILILCMIVVSSNSYAYITHADSPNFTLNTAGLILSIGGAAHADSADFTLNTPGIISNTGGAAHGDSGNFALNTGAGTPLVVGGFAQADSADFRLNTIAGTPLSIGGATFADSAIFRLNTLAGTVASVGGVRHGDSANFTLNTRAGTLLSVGGARFSDSADFTLNTTGAPRAIATALGLAFNGSSLSISWPTSSGSFSLQFTTNLNPPNWTTFSNPPATIGTNFISTVAATNPIEFFRLKSN